MRRRPCVVNIPVESYNGFEAHLTFSLFATAIAEHKTTRASKIRQIISR